MVERHYTQEAAVSNQQSAISYGQPEACSADR